MATKRIKVGSVIKSKDPSKSHYLKVDGNLKAPIVLKPGMYLQVETAAFQKSSLERAVAENKISPENSEKAFERINKIPEFVMAEVVLIQKE